MHQLPLGIVLPESKTFATFVDAANLEAIASLRQHIEQHQFGPCYFYGNAQTGKSHLLQAACHLAADRLLRPVYLPLQPTEPLQPEVLAGLETLDLIAIDDLQLVAGFAPWERALFTLLNAAREHSTVVVIAADNTPEALGIRLPDLRSRLEGGLIYRLQPLEDGAKLQALRVHAAARGMELGEEAGRYLLAHYPRDMGSLFELLNRLDQASMVAQRRLTIPFIRQALEQR